MSAFFERGLDRAKALELTHPVGMACRDQAVTLLEAASTTFGDVSDAAHAEGADAARAAADLGRADAEAEAAFDRTYNACQARLFTLRNGPSADLAAFETNYALAFGEDTPSTFAELGIDRALSRLERVHAFAKAELGDADPVVDAAEDALARLDKCRTVSDVESAEYAEAMTRLIAARDRARRDYSAARSILAAALKLEESDDLGQVMPPLYSIYQPSSVRTDAPAPSEDADAPAPATDADAV